MITIMTAFNTLRRLRTFLGKEQREMAVIAGCSRHTVESVEQGRLRLSARLATKISEATGIDYNWLLAGDTTLPMVARDGAPYRQKDFELAQDSELSKPLPLYQFAPEMQVGVGADLVYRALKAARRRNAVPEFLKRFNHYVRSEIRRFPEFRNEVRGQWQHETRKGGGKWQFEHKSGVRKELLLPRDEGPLQRNKRPCLEAIAEFRAWEKVSNK
jgi:transcriptional regulator with XRE-family HTH domain